MAERMIERIATMIQQMHGEPGQTWQEFADTAYAVVRDMRQPTGAMLKAADGKAPMDAWAAMIDEILTEHVELGADDALADDERIESHRTLAPHELLGDSGA
jgi:hypothetical protein